MREAVAAVALFFKTIISQYFGVVKRFRNKNDKNNVKGTEMIKVMELEKVMKTKIKLIPLEVGQKVIFRDGVTGHIASVNKKSGAFEVEFDEPYKTFYWRGGRLSYNCKLDAVLDKFYLLGKNLLKNKYDEYQIEALKKDIEWHGQFRDVLRKQLFTLEKQMVDDWEVRQGKIPKTDISSETPLKSSVLNESKKEDS